MGKVVVTRSDRIVPGILVSVKAYFGIIHGEQKYFADDFLQVKDQENLTNTDVSKDFCQIPEDYGKPVFGDPEMLESLLNGDPVFVADKMLGWVIGRVDKETFIVPTPTAAAYHGFELLKAKDQPKV